MDSVIFTIKHPTLFPNEQKNRIELEQPWNRALDWSVLGCLYLIILEDRQNSHNSQRLIIKHASSDLRSTVDKAQEIYIEAEEIYWGWGGRGEGSCKKGK